MMERTKLFVSRLEACSWKYSSTVNFFVAFVFKRDATTAYCSSGKDEKNAALYTILSDFVC